NLLAYNWMQEGTKSLSVRSNSRSNQQVYYDQYGNRMTAAQIRGSSSSTTSSSSSSPQGIPVERILPTAPGEAWLALIDPGMIPNLHALFAQLTFNAKQPEAALDYLKKLTATHPDKATETANQLLATWTGSRQLNRRVSSSSYRYNSYGGYPAPYYHRPQTRAVPLTRALQKRNLVELSGWLKAFEELGLNNLDRRAMVNAFAAAHSYAEVYREEDIEEVFGSADSVDPKTMETLLQTMRQRLAGMWRSQRVQQQAQTKRKNPEINAEVLRGYTLIASLVERVLKQQPEDWPLHVLRGAILFDLAEFRYGNKVDLAIYVEKRELAFESFRQAAGFYANKVETLKDSEWTPMPYHAWFNANLGASDLAYVTRQQDPNLSQIDMVREAILALPGDLGQKHLGLFAQQLFNSVSSLRPELKQKYLRAGLLVVGEHEAAKGIHDLVQYYDELLEEISLDVRIDGDATVGHQQPFGIFVHLRHSASLARESGGFGHYLRKPNSRYGGAQP
ncbi:MAG: hypothetical protein AAF492_21145, partial [Verrucomicrobiota bacterium]